MTVHTRPAQDDDFRRLVGRDPPPTWLGLAAVDEGEVIALGTVFWDDYGRAWGGYSAIRPLPPVTMHRAARRVLGVLQTVGEPAIHVFCSQTIPGSEKWLRRLGFKPLPELTTDPNHPVWVWVCTISN